MPSRAGSYLKIGNSHPRPQVAAEFLSQMDGQWILQLHEMISVVGPVLVAWGYLLHSRRRAGDPLTYRGRAAHPLFCISLK